MEGVRATWGIPWGFLCVGMEWIAASPAWEAIPGTGLGFSAAPPAPRELAGATFTASPVGVKPTPESKTHSEVLK